MWVPCDNQVAFCAFTLLFSSMFSLLMPPMSSLFNKFIFTAQKKNEKEWKGICDALVG